MSAPHPPAGRCTTDDHCVTCSDEGVPMRVESCDDTGLAVCVDDGGNRTDVLIGLVPDVRAGDWLLVHAGTALLRVEAPTEATP